MVSRTESRHYSDSNGPFDEADTNRMELADFERIARAALRELGAASTQAKISLLDGKPGTWRIEVQTPKGPGTLKIRCSPGTTAQWVREQIFDQYHAL